MNGIRRALGLATGGLVGWHGYARFEQRAEAKHPAARCMSVHDARIYLRLNALPHFPHAIIPGLYPPIANLV